ncbi:GntR family transcriptional regulator [Rhodococcus sp. KBW08]|uniref:FadR/GntR family transcriptional regulator n=1 Tax=Rhodococcus sp. KBW08 TaxID=2144188 RepID=UPI000F591241|nr:FCD domain-containing protein [Rhodococcus sp. KBW08]RQO42753.1 GntR family transcriptional regulator [Rhodococcus sp. KBW08]
MPDFRIAPTARNVPLSVQIAEQLRSQITSGNWKLGEGIPGEHQLVEMTGASRNTVREAIRGLVHAGLLEARPGDGTYVCASSELEIALQRRAAAENVLEIFEAREALELYAARLAAERALPEDIDRMTRALDRRDAEPDVAKSVEHDLDFHLEMFAASGNQLITDIYRSLDRSDTMSIPQGKSDKETRQLFIEPWTDDDPHRQLLAAIRDRDPDGAAAAVVRLMDHSRSLFLRNTPK